jgi:hypothetical protein
MTQFLPGTEIVGHAVYWREGQQPQILPPLFPVDPAELIPLPGISSSADGYVLPARHFVNNTTQPATTNFAIFNSWNELKNDTNLGVGIALPSTGLGIGWQQLQEYQQKDESLYAVLTSYTPFYELYLDPNSIELSSVSVPFSLHEESAYQSFFNEYGTHYIRRAIVGGQLIVLISETKTTKVSIEETKLGLNGLLSLIRGVNLDTGSRNALVEISQTSNAYISSVGGDPLLAQSINPFDLPNLHGQYQAWLQSIPSNPEVLHYTPEGIWNLIEDQEQLQALETAYKYFCKLPHYQIEVKLQTGDLLTEENDSWSGTKGQSTPLAGFRLNFTSHQDLVDFEYSGKFSDSGNLGPFPKLNGDRFCGNIESNINPPSHVSGTRLQGLSIRLTGPWANRYDVHYQAHVSFRGDTRESYSNGDWCGRESQYEVPENRNYPANIEAIRVWLEYKSS